MDWIHLAQAMDHLAGSYECLNEPWGCKNVGEFLD